MKKFGRRCAALTAALALGLSLAQPVRASEALGSEVSQWSAPLGTGTTLTGQSLWSASKSDLRTEHYVTYTPNGTVKPVVFSGAFVASTNTVESAAAQLAEQGCRVVAAVNGGFFNTDGTAVGMLMTDGVLRSLDVENYTLLGFTGDGRVFIDESTPVMTASWVGTETVLPPSPQPEPTPTPEATFSPEPTFEPGTDPWSGVETGSWPWPESTPAPSPEPTTVTVSREIKVAGFNAYRNNNYLGGLYLYNKEFSSRVTAHGTSVSAILRPLGEGGMKMNGSMVFEVVSVTDTALEGVTFDGNIPEGCYMLYAEDHNNADLFQALRGLPVGGQVTVSMSGASGQWQEAAYGVSGLYTLLRDGQIPEGLPAAANPYTAVGLKSDGTAVFYTIDGRQSGYSIGASYRQVAQRLQELGCVSAVALDGGGSTTLGATLPGSAGFSIVNKPSSPGRRINNTIALVCPEGADIFTPGAYVTAGSQVVLAGSQLPLTALSYDSQGRPSGQPPQWSAAGGTVSQDENGAVYTAGSEAGSYVVAASPSSPGVSVRVVDRLSSLTVSRKGSNVPLTSLILEPGDMVDLSVAGAWWNLPVAMSRDSISWTMDEGLGAINEEGQFIAGQRNMEGEITVTAGGITLTVPVKIEGGCPFTDIGGHWGLDYIVQLYKLGLTTGSTQEDGTVVYRPNTQITRAELMVFVTRVLGINPLPYDSVELPFTDRDSIPEWALPYVKVMYTLKVVQGSQRDGQLYVDAGSTITREETMTILGRILAGTAQGDLSVFEDGSSVSAWAAPHVQTLVGLGIVQGSGGRVNPRDYIDRASIAKLLVEIFPLEKALLLPRLDLMS